MIKLRVLAALVAGLFIFAACTSEIEVTREVEVSREVVVPEALETARRQKSAYAEALEQGLGAINVDGVMVDAASIRIVQNLIDRADLIDM